MDKLAAAQTSRRTTLLRIAFGLVWAIDAVFKWQPAFLRGFMDDISAAAAGQPAWLHWWFQFWMNLIMHNPMFFAVLTAIVETLLAIALILGIARKLTYIGGSIFAFLIWGIGEGFGGPYASGATDIGGAVIYIFVFAALSELERSAPSSWTIRNFISLSRK